MVTIRPATAADVPDVAALMAASFSADDAITRYFKGLPGIGTAQHESALAKLFAQQLSIEYLPLGRVDLAYENSELLGAGCWYPPDAPSPTVRDYFRMFGRHAPLIMARECYADMFTPRQPHWYLYTLAVAPAAQGRGVGSALLSHGLARADDADMPCYLEATTPDSQRLYERWGFVAQREIPTPGAQPNEVGMCRNAS
ncbi:GNAT family N-acetyltransferase [Corynebacterium sp. H128]|uniref:GNAT family N-acetyltransferase n=1 Tax=unclassified Corynebacterium TaxID=2624378 RepID=UPI00309761EB